MSAPPCRRPREAVPSHRLHALTGVAAHLGCWAHGWAAAAAAGRELDGAQVGSQGQLRSAAAAPPGWLVGCCCCAGRTRAVIAVHPGRQVFGVHCHCRRCQRYHGAAFASVVGFDAASVLLLGDPSKLARSEPSDPGRLFCRGCGTPVVNDSAVWNTVGTFPPMFHSTDEHAELPAWVWDRHEWLGSRAVEPAADGLPRYLDTPVEFGGSGKLLCT